MGKLMKVWRPGAAGSAGDIIAEAPSENTETEVPSGEITSPVRTDGGVLTGRPILWRAGLQTFEKHPLFGVTREKLVPATVPELSNPAWEPDLTAGGVHNGYLTVLICSGITGTACLLGLCSCQCLQFPEGSCRKETEKTKERFDSDAAKGSNRAATSLPDHGTDGSEGSVSDQFLPVSFLAYRGISDSRWGGRL